MKSKNFNLDGYLNDKPKKVVIRKKKCRMCGIWKLITEFNKDKNKLDGYGFYCSECAKNFSKKYANKNIEKNKKRNLYNNIKKKCPKCKQWKPRTRKNWTTHLSNKDGLQSICIECRSIRRKMRVYNITEKEYDGMIEKQESKCKICGDVLTRTGRKGFAVDHNHKSGDIRGLLCGDCNKGIGCLKDNPFILFKAIRYIRGELD